MSSIIVFSVFQLHDMAYAEIFPLWAVSPKNHGGLSYSSEEVGEVLAISGMYYYRNVTTTKQSCGNCSILLNSQSQRGAANGISMTVMSLFKAAGPAGGGAL
ncbi:hypothetical protein F8388_010708 [Cannabis sativa]|uniref:Uncharacterized protein n=1 Tax=Cannabis sativa TaxID=3483 RepID=A0A7J6G842_CANSA|nr:hypothetical protein F8388_010708 [Cannabis sativa]